MLDQYGISKDNILYLNRNSYFERVPFATSVPEFDIRFHHGRHLQPAELFKRPFVVELIGASFDKPANARYFALRFPRVLKIHEDRSFKDTISFEELQGVAKRCSEVPEDSGGEVASWLWRLGRSDYLVEGSRSGSPSDENTEIRAIREPSKHSFASGDDDDGEDGEGKDEIEVDSLIEGESEEEGDVVMVDC